MNWVDRLYDALINDIAICIIPIGTVLLMIFAVFLIETSEISGQEYQEIKALRDSNPAINEAIENALDDGEISNNEYNKIFTIHGEIIKSDLVNP